MVTSFTGQTRKGGQTTPTFALPLPPGYPLFKLCGSSRANRFNRIASALKSERAKQFQIGHYLNPARGAETSYFFCEEIRISRTDDVGISGQCGTEHGFVRWISQQLLRHR